MTALVVKNQNPAIALMPSQQEWQIIKEQASMLVRSNFLPDAIKTPEQAIAIALKGREIGVPMMQAFAHIVIIKGKPTMSAELMIAQIYRLCPEAKITFVEMTEKVCRIKASRPNSPEFEFVFSWEDAVRADLANKDNWRKWPRAMLRSRCVSEMARSMFADALMGISYTPEELDPDGVKVDEDGNVIDITPIEKGPSKGPIAPPAAPSVSRADKCVARFSEIGVTRQQLEAVVSKPLSELTDDDFEELATLYADLKAMPEKVASLGETKPQTLVDRIKS